MTDSVYRNIAINNNYVIKYKYINLKRLQRKKMKINSLTYLAATNIQFDQIGSIPDFLKRKIHHLLSPSVIKTRWTKNRGLSGLCNCDKKPNCLCYFTETRKDIIEQYWGEEDNYEVLGDLCKN